MKKFVLIAGGAGNLGRVVVEHALDRGWRVRAADVSLEGLDGLDSDRLETVKVDLRDEAAIDPILEGVTDVISVVGLQKERADLGITFETVDKQANIDLFKAADRAGIEKVVYVSICNCEKAKKPGTLRAKRAVERFLEGSSLNYTIFRPSGLFHDFIHVFKPMIEKNKVRCLGDGSIILQPLATEDLAVCLLDSLDNREADRKNFEIGGPQKFSFVEVIEMMAGIMGQEVKINCMPLLLVRHIAWAIHRVKPGAFLSPGMIEAFSMDTIIDTGPVEKTFGIELKPLEPFLRSQLAG